jgi:FlaA1/EpsC-like NDP-sugar epimerase
LHGKLLGGLPVFSEKTAFDKIIKQRRVSEIILAINKGNISIERKSEIINRSLKANIKIREIPEASNWINGKLSTTQIKEINIEDLLSRNPIQLDKEKIGNDLLEKNVLVTGAAGSIGSEMVRQLIKFNLKNLILVDNAESPLFALQNEINSLKKEINVIYILGNVTDEVKMEHILKNYHPEIIYHAAAYKHVPLMEEHPYEAIKCNIGGLKTMADLSIKYEVEKFVMISTDKAVNPTNVMGASKRICEIYIQSLSQDNRNITKFITTRFGNVLGSNGSVIPIFKRQIRNGGPVQITHKEITRYFMTIPEACQLVMEAGYMGNGGEIFIFDMGKSIKIYDLAEKLIFLSGFIPHKEIFIEEIGLRPGEKLYEELLTSNENTLPTHNKKIMIGKNKFFDFTEQKKNIEELLTNLTEYNEKDLVKKMKKIVPEYISMNSKFESLD